MDFVNLPLFFAAALVFLSVLSGVFSNRAGFSILLVFLFAGILMGEDGIGGLHFDDFVLSFWVGNVALAVILLDGGLRTQVATFRTGLKPSLMLATLGVAVTAAITGFAATLLLDIDWRLGLLLGAIVGSTDAAAVFAQLRHTGITLNERVAATLEIESGMNDPMAVYLTLALIALLTATDTRGGPLATMAFGFVQQFGLGAAIGLAAGFGMAALVRRLPAEQVGGGILALLLASAGLAVFAATGLLNGSGFLAVYLFGLVLANRARERVKTALSAMDGFAWLSQAGMFVLLGLLATPSMIAQSTGPALALAAVLMFVARPAAVWLCLAPFRFKRNEIWFVSWVGLRGAVPIVLAVFPLLAGVPKAMLLFNVAFAVVIASMLLQGTTIGVAGRWLRVALPPPDDEAAQRRVFGDFTLDARAPVGTVFDFYRLSAPDDPHLPIGEWLAQTLGRPAVVGDHVERDSARLSVRAMDGARITAVGLRLDEPQA